LNDKGYVICRHGNNVSYNRLFSQGAILADIGLLITNEHQNKIQNCMEYVQLKTSIYI